MDRIKKTVVITGASSGIGRSSVMRMSRAGWRVFATVRKSADRDRFLAEQIPGVIPVELDVANRSSIVAAAEQVISELSGSGLDGLVNVAGIGMVRPIEFATVEDLKEIFEINLFGQIEITQALCRPLREARGRIVNITSIGINVAIPFGGLLNASKSAFAMMSDTMRLELRPFGIRVCNIEPGAIATPAVGKTLGNIEQVIANLPAEGQERYGSMLRTFARQAYDRESKGSSPDVVAEAVHLALTSRRPRIRYRVGKHAKLLATLPRLLPEWLLDDIRLRMFGMNVPPQSDIESSRDHLTG